MWDPGDVGDVLVLEAGERTVDTVGPQGVRSDEIADGQGQHACLGLFGVLT